MITVPSFQAIPWLRHAFTTRRAGVSTVYGDPPSLNLGYTREDDPVHVAKNRSLLVRQLADHATLVTVRQVHGTSLHFAEPSGPGPQPALEADGILTRHPGLLLGIQVADCVPILLVDTHLRAVAAIHAGWRGTAAGILRLAVQQMQSHFGSNPANLLAAIGPAIGARCYVVGDEVRSRFEPGLAEVFEHLPDGLHLNLAEANRRQLLGAGLASSQISVVAQCTACTLESGTRKFFSHRAEHGIAGRAMGVIGIVHPATK